MPALPAQDKNGKKLPVFGNIFPIWQRKMIERRTLRTMSKLYAVFLVIASMLALSGLGVLGLVLITHLINLFG